MGAAASFAFCTAPAMLFSALCCCCTGLSCVCTCAHFFTCCCRGATGSESGISHRLAKIFYILLMACCMILSLIFRFNDGLSLGVLSVSCSGSTVSINVTGQTAETKVYCKGDAAVFRVSFILVVFFSLMLFASLLSEELHRGFWFLKVFLVVGGVIGSLFMQDSSFNNEAYAWVSRFGSLLFLVLQILVLIDFAYGWNDIWVARGYKEDGPTPTNPYWIYAVIASAVILYILAITGVALLFVNYAACEVGKVFTSLTIIFVIGVTILSLFRDKIVGVEGAILPSAVISAYMVFLNWSALESNPDNTCRPTSQQTAATIVLGGVWATLTLIWTTFSVASNSQHLVRGEDLESPPMPNDEEKGYSRGGGAPRSQPAGGPVLRADNNEGPVGAPPPAVGDGDAGEEDTWSGPTEKAWLFHLIMISASMYMAMLLTDWGAFGATGTNDKSLQGTVSMWVKAAAEWVTMLLFTWTLIAPGVLKGRDFS